MDILHDDKITDTEQFVWRYPVYGEDGFVTHWVDASDYFAHYEDAMATAKSEMPGLAKKLRLVRIRTRHSRIENEVDTYL